MKRDYYEVLGIAKTATDDEIRKAYKKIALESHPDRNPGNAKAAEKFKEATEAFGVLNDSQAKGLYDQFGHEERGDGVRMPTEVDVIPGILAEWISWFKQSGIAQMAVSLGMREGIAFAIQRGVVEVEYTNGFFEVKLPKAWIEQQIGKRFP